MLTELWSLKGRYKILHLTWFAFFLSFVVWFNFAPLATAIQDDMGLEISQIRTLAICNVALTVPARIIIGMLLDKYGPRITYSLLLIYAAIPCTAFALAQNFNQLVISRLALSIVGAGFVIGIRMVAEWFPPKEIGLAEGIYGGWGNFGSAAAAFSLPTLAAILTFGSGGVINWRVAVALTGIIAAAYGAFYFFNVQDTPPGKVYQKPKRARGLEVTTPKDFWFLMLMNIPLVGVLAILAWRLSKVGFLTLPQLYIVWVALFGLYLFQGYNCWEANKELILGHKHYPPADRYNFSQVAILELTYFVNFGSELAVVSMLPAFFENTFGLSKPAAGMIAASYAFMNLMSRPGGGLISDKLGSRKNTMAVLTAGMAFAYLIMGRVNGGWWLPLAVLLTMTCSFFVQAGEGSSFAIVPLIKRRVTGQIAGNVGAYGNVGAVVYLTLFSLFPEGDIGNRIFFEMLGVTSMIVAFLCWFFLKEPQGSFADHHQEELQANEDIIPVAK
ncbi:MULTISPECIES: MFS transporter [Oscillatoriales]|uniref:Nitrate/nitrite transporter n=2 Tax=Limnospira TaxID=2596745 RepID=B5W2A1_LIMMA|nr:MULTISPECIES: NarK family nitrate/nitrite MFS transporter [Oscillatoriales]AMW27711.1 MFS transporter [Arthrospira platensis YZ]EKD11213.1 nitrite transporter [Arthrospira platensis C1]MBD2710190.1 MFS transporter [Arthrospira platensis FACHB-835]MDC0837555.1 MFS transporter [Limnoraphis robusta]MDY7052990.1 MFS transporter [Limnospira fusiformis LS22]QJB27428.1 MFS transporter [Limnospira fusiformis SAG 85.79]